MKKSKIMALSSYLNTVYYLLLTEYRIFKQTVFDKLFDVCIWVFTMIPITIYLFPAFGMQISYGAFMIVSMAASAGLFEQWTSTTNLVSDLEGDNVTAFYLILPIPSWLSFVARIIFYTFNGAILSIGIMPLCKLFFWNYFDLSQINIFAYIIIFLLTNILYAAMTLWLTSMVPNLERIGSVWMRFLYPLWTFGAFQYSYKVLHEVNPTLAYLSFINPFLYVMEGTRAAVLGQEGSLNVWFCAIMILLFALLFAAYGIARLKKRLDYV